MDIILRVCIKILMGLGIIVAMTPKTLKIKLSMVHNQSDTLSDTYSTHSMLMDEKGLGEGCIYRGDP
jgi:hypothetical protein